MNARGSPRMLHARDAALHEYLDALLFPEHGAPSRGAAPIAAAAEQGEPEPIAAMPTEAVPPVCAAPDPGACHSARYRVCNVAGVRLAVPLADIEAEHGLDSPLLNVPDAPSWCMGAIDIAGRLCHVIDLARVVTPALATRAAPTVAIALVGGDWVLACDALGEEIALARDEVRWRELAGDRPWLAGTAMVQRCAVVDVLGLSGQLAREMAHG